MHTWPVFLHHGLTAKRKSLKEDLAGGSPQAVRPAVNGWRIEEKKGCVRERRGGLHNARARLPLTPCLARAGRFLHLQRSKVWSSEKTPRATGAGVGVECQREMELEHECVFFSHRESDWKGGEKAHSIWMPRTSKSLLGIVSLLSPYLKLHSPLWLTSEGPKLPCTWFFQSSWLTFLYFAFSGSLFCGDLALSLHFLTREE